jgi:bifunctional DNA-binding transcriptional regulator/antitoxin component of YhaV-PrlF toxin-antitoxin module
MPAETFTAKIQKALRIQIPVLLRWKYKLDPGTILKVELTRTSPLRKTRFYARLQKSGRLAIPKLVAETNELKKGDVVEATIWIEL